MNLMKKLFGNKRKRNLSLQAEITDYMNEAYKSLDNFWKVRAGNDSKMGIAFITYFKSKEVLFTTFDELSFAEVDNGNIKLSDSNSMKITAQIVKDKNRIALVFFTGRFNKQQAKEVILIFSKHADRKANKKYLAEASVPFAIKAKEKGMGLLVWIDWP